MSVGVGVCVNVCFIIDLTAVAIRICGSSIGALSCVSVGCNCSYDLYVSYSNLYNYLLINPPPRDCTKNPIRRTCLRLASLLSSSLVLLHTSLSPRVPVCPSVFFFFGGGVLGLGLREWWTPVSPSLFVWVCECVCVCFLAFRLRPERALYTNICVDYSSRNPGRRSTANRTHPSIHFTFFNKYPTRFKSPGSLQFSQIIINVSGTGTLEVYTVYVYVCSCVRVSVRPLRDGRHVQLPCTGTGTEPIRLLANVELVNLKCRLS